jgi:hypothetical protein
MKKFLSVLDTESYLIFSLPSKNGGKLYYNGLLVKDLPVKTLATIKIFDPF